MVSSIAISDHRVTLFYFFESVCPVEMISLSDLKQGKLPGIENINQDGKETPGIWHKHPYNISRDLIKPIHKLFHNGAASQIKTWKIEASILAQINQQAGQPLQLYLKPSASERLQQSGTTDCHQVHLTLENILYHQFNTGFGVACVELFINNPEPTDALLVETTYSLSRFNKLGWGVDSQVRIRMGEIIRNLVCPGKGSNKKSHIARIYTHTYLQIGMGEESDIQGIEDDRLNRLLVKLSLHYTDSYQIVKTGENREMVHDFQNIAHCLALEGSASVVLLDPQSDEILKDYKNKVIRPVHIPIHLLSFHAEQAMHQLVSNTHSWQDRHLPNHKALSQLEQDQQKLLHFKLNYFHPVISHINSHNRLHHALAHIKHLNAQHQSLAENITTISQIISAKQQFKYCKIAALGVAAAAYLTAFSIIKEGIEAINEWHVVKEQLPKIADCLHHYTGSISLSGSLLLAFITYLVVRRHCPFAGGGHAHSASHHVLETIHKRHPLQHKSK